MGSHLDQPAFVAPLQEPGDVDPYVVYFDISGEGIAAQPEIAGFNRGRTIPVVNFLHLGPVVDPLGNMGVPITLKLLST